MSKATRELDKLSFTEKFSRLRKRMKKAKWRRYGMLLMAGKMLGLIALLSIIGVGTAVVSTAWDWTHPAVAHAQEPATSASTIPVAPPDPYKTATGGDIINPLN